MKSQKREKFSFVEFILTVLQRGAEFSLDMMDTYFRDYYSSYKKARRGMLGELPKRFEKEWAEIYRERQKFYSTLNRLKRDGLIEGKKEDKYTLWDITDKGIKRADKHRKRSKAFIEKKSSPNFLIISYDIPEKFKNQRDWLRGILKLLDFDMIHKSTWKGKNKIPEELLKELKEREIIEYVHIFELSKSGTLKEIID